MKQNYFDATTGREVDESIALDHGVLRSGFSIRTAMTARDAATRHAEPQFSDGSRMLDLSAGNRPGFRIPTVNDRRPMDDRRAVVRDAYAKADKQASHQWKCHDNEAVCDDCDGDGYDENGVKCLTCNGEGVIPERDSRSKGSGGGFGCGNEGGGYDSRNRVVSLDQHRQTMDRLYRARDAADSNAWRGPT